MTTINPYINFNGNAEAAFNFYKAVFGGDFETVVRFKDLETADFQVPVEDADKIMRIVLPIGDSRLIANDVPARMGPVSENENRSKIAVSVDSRAEADRVFAGLTAGASIEVPLGDSPWGSYFGMFRDQFGIEWTVEYDAAT